MRFPYIFTRFGLGVLLLSGLLLAGPAQAQSAPITLKVTAGFDGYYEMNQWLPVRVEVTNTGPDVKATLQIDMPRTYSGGQIVFTRAVDLPTQSHKEFFMYVTAEGYLNSLKVVLRSGSKVLAEASQSMVSLNAQDTVYGLVANNPSAYNDLANLDPVGGSAVVARLAVADLPPQPNAWAILDVLVFSDVDTAALTAEQRTALADWVGNGGVLIVAGGATWQKTSAGVKDLLPVTITGSRTVSDLTAVQTFASQAQPLPGSGVVAESTALAGTQVLAEMAGLPLVAARRTGYGAVMFLAVEPAFAPLTGWSGWETFFRNMLAGPVRQPAWTSGFVDWNSAANAARAVPGGEVPAWWQVCGYLFIYVVLVGPLNFLVLRRLKRRELAWLTIPIIVVGCSCISYITGFVLYGTTPLLHRLTVVSVPLQAKMAQVDQIVGLFSPRRSVYDLEFAPGFLARPVPDYSSSTASLPPIQEGDVTRVQELRTEIGALQVVAAQGQAPVPAFTADLTLEIAGASIMLKGSVTNASELILTEAVLLAPGIGSVERLGEFGPGQTKTVSMYLNLSQAMPASRGMNTLGMPVWATGVSSGISAPPVPTSSDTTLVDILGYSYPSNREEYRRNSLLTALLGYSGGGRGDGVYLVGWTSASPVETKLTTAYRTSDLSVYLMALPYQLELENTDLMLAPGLLVWEALPPEWVGGTLAYNNVPYSVYLNTNESLGLSFMPAIPVTFSRAQQLTVHLTLDAAYSVGGQFPLRVYLWSFANETWELQTDAHWGDTPIATPERYVGPTGQVLIRVVNTAITSYYLSAVDLTLTLEQ